MAKWSTKLGTFALATACIILMIGTYITPIVNRNQASGYNIVDNILPESKSPSTPSPHPQTITDTDNSTGVGQPLSAVEYANSTNASQSIGPFSNNSYGMGSIAVPPSWNAYNLFANVSGLTDNRSYSINGTCDTNATWQYEETIPDEEGLNTNGTNSRETSWGWWTATPPVGTTSGALFLHNGYNATLANHHISPTDYCAWNETTYVDRQNLAAVRVGFNYWANHTNYGDAQLFVQLNSLVKYFPTFEGGAANNSWQYMQFDLTPTEITTLSTPGPILIKIGIQVIIGPFFMTHNDGPNGYTYQEVYLDNISLWIKGNAKPSQLQLKLNGTSINDISYGAGSITLNGNWQNPSSVNFSPLNGNFTSGNSTNIQLVTTFIINTNRTKQSQMQDGTSGTSFLVSNNTVTNWTAYYYAYTPYGYSNYNFTLAFPTDWVPWAVYDPSFNPVLSQLTWGSGFLQVNSAKASQAGFWEFEFSVPNYVAQLSVYRNSTPGPNNWLGSTQFMAGDYINVTAKIAGIPPVAGTIAQLDFKLPNGTIWSGQSHPVSVLAGGTVNFPAVHFPATNQPDYQAGTYKVFVTWNNSVGTFGFNETGVNVTMILVQHQSVVVPDTPVFSGFTEGQTMDLYVSFLDIYSGIPISGGYLWFTDMGNNLQTMTMIRAGYYYAQTTILYSQNGEVNITINGSQLLFASSVANISFHYNLLTNVVTNSSQTDVVWGNSFTFDVNFTMQATQVGITGAILSTDWDAGLWIWQEKGNGNYSITCDSSAKIANRLYTLLLSVSESGLINQSLAFGVFVTPRVANINGILVNGTDITVNKSIDVAITSDVQVTASWLDAGSWGTISGATLQLVGIGSTPLSFVQVGSSYLCTIPGNALSLGTHYVTIAASKANFQDASVQLEILIHKIKQSMSTIENVIAYSINTTQSFRLGIFIQNLDFGGTIAGCNVTYEWANGQGTLVDNGTGYYSADLGQLPAGTWEINIHVYKGADYESADYAITVVVTTTQGLPVWSLYLMGAALAGVVVAILSYLFYFRFPPIVRGIHAIRRGINKQKSVAIETRPLDATFAGDFLNQSQRVLPNATQVNLKKRYVNVQKEEDQVREDPNFSQQRVSANENNDIEGGNQE